VAVEGGVERLPDNTHPTLANFLDEAVMGDGFADHVAISIG
jgi:hypothetical protein